MDELNFFARDKKLPREMTIHLRDFLSQTVQFQRQRQYEDLLSNFSAQLKAQAALMWAKGSLMRVPYFKVGTVEDEFLASAALALRPQLMCRTESISVESLAVIERGIAAREGRIYTKGACLGSDMVLSSITFRNLNPAIALTFVVQIATLDKKSLEALLVSYPRARREIRSAAFRIAFSRAVILVAKELAKGGPGMSVLQAFVEIRKTKARKALEHRIGEPTRKLLASSISDLAERTEQIALKGETVNTELTDKMRSLDVRVTGMDKKMDTLIATLNSAVRAKARPASRQKEKAVKAAAGRVRGNGTAIVSNGAANGGGSGGGGGCGGGGITSPSPVPGPVVSSSALLSA